MCQQREAAADGADGDEHARYRHERHRAPRPPQFGDLEVPRRLEDQRRQEYDQERVGEILVRLQRRQRQGDDEQRHDIGDAQPLGRNADHQGYAQNRDCRKDRRVLAHRPPLNLGGSGNLRLRRVSRRDDA